jgi:hypothetical protein
MFSEMVTSSGKLIVDGFQECQGGTCASPPACLSAANPTGLPCTPLSGAGAMDPAAAAMQGGINVRFHCLDPAGAETGCTGILAVSMISTDSATGGAPTKWARINCTKIGLPATGKFITVPAAALQLIADTPWVSIQTAVVRFGTAINPAGQEETVTLGVGQGTFGLSAPSVAVGTLAFISGAAPACQTTSQCTSTVSTSSCRRSRTTAK